MKRILLLVAVALATAATGVALAAQSDSGTLWVSATHAEGQDLYVSGDVKSKLYGRGAIVYITRVRPDEQGSILIRARRVTAYFARGSFVGTGSATQTTQGETTTVTDGRFTLRGTGAYRGKRFTGTFSGDLREGVYTFAYKGTVR